MHNSQIKLASSQLLLAVKQSRPRFWLYTAGPFLLGSVIGSVLHAQAGFNYLYFSTMFLYFLFVANYLMYGVNDYFDYETDLLNPKKDSKEVRVSAESRSTLKKWLLVTSAISVTLIFFQPSIISAGLLGAFLFGAIGYSMPPLRFKDRILADSFSNGFYVLPGFLGYAVFTESLPALIMIVACWVWAMAMHLYSAIPDIVYDKKAGMKTTAVWLGKSKSLLLCLVLWAIFASTLVITLGLYITTFVAFVYPLIPLLHLLVPSIKIEKVYWWFPYITTAIGATATVEFLLYTIL
jgi:lycopene elongase/hydratase (dihydrobisanhydrobacterioruberin-forming)